MTPKKMEPKKSLFGDEIFGATDLTSESFKAQKKARAAPILSRGGQKAKPFALVPFSVVIFLSPFLHSSLFISSLF
jgi:hypothetical protein